MLTPNESPRLLRLAHQTEKILDNENTLRTALILRQLSLSCPLDFAGKVSDVIEMHRIPEVLCYYCPYNATCDFHNIVSTAYSQIVLSLMNVNWGFCVTQPLLWDSMGSPSYGSLWEAPQVSECIVWGYEKPLCNPSLFIASG